MRGPLTPRQGHPAGLGRWGGRAVSKHRLLLQDLPPAPASSTPHPGYLLSSSAILRDVKEDGAGASLPRHPGLQRHSRGLARVRHSPSTPSLTPSHIHPCLRRTPHLRTLTPLTHARGQWG